MPDERLPALGSVRAAFDKLIASTIAAGGGVSTTGLVCWEGNVVRFDLSWTLAVLGYLLLAALHFSVVLLHVMGV